jgi:hypothetical protein
MKNIELPNKLTVKIIDGERERMTEYDMRQLSTKRGTRREESNIKR